MTNVLPRRLRRCARAWPTLVLLVVLAGCERRTPSTSRPEAASPGSASAPATATVLLNWFPEAEHGGYFAALVNGYFAEEGLEVRILSGGPGASVVPRVATRQVDFGVENADHVVMARAEGAAVVALFAPIQVHPRCIMVHAESGITNLAGLRNMTLAMNPAAAFAQFLQHRLPLPGVRVVPYAGNVSQFVADSNLAQQAYTFSEPFAATAAGAKPHCLLLADAGFNPYTSCLLVSEALLRDRPALAAKMVRAAARGWEEYLRDPKPANARIHELNPAMDAALLDFGARALRDLCRDSAAPDLPFGGMTLARWQALGDALAEIGLIKPGAVDPQACFRWPPDV